MRIAFSKMQGLGNDFVVINAITQSIEPTPELCRAIADRRFGIGCDQILLLQAPQQPDTDFYYRIFNQDGSEAEQCGNGARCIANFIRRQELINSQNFTIGTIAGPIRLFLESEMRVRVDMGVPRFEPTDIPFLAGQKRLKYPFIVDGINVEIGAVSMGNPHAVLQVPNLEQAQVKRFGPRIESHPRFPNRVNVGFVQIMDRGYLKLRVYERGVGETLACGTGACAAMAVGRAQGLLDEKVRVSQQGGDLVIEWLGDKNPLWMTGPAVWVFDGEIEI